MQAEIIYNPLGGKGAVRHVLDHVVDFLSRSGWSVDLRETTRPLEATNLARKAVANGAGVVIAAGGDGTVNEVANGLVHTEAALGVLPVGTTNTWALQMGIPALNPILPGTQAAKLVAGLEELLARPLPANYYRKVLMDAARVLVEGQTLAIDVGELSGRYFLISAGIGMEAAIVESVSQREKKALGSWAYVLGAIESAYKYTGTEVRLTLDDKTLDVSTPLVVVTNIQLYGGMVAIGAKARVNDGKLDVYVFKGEGFFTFVNHAMKVLAHRHLTDPKVEYHQCREVLVESSRQLPVHVDAEPYATTPVAIKAVPSSLKVILPEKLPGELFGIGD